MKANTPLRQGLDQILEIQENGDQTPLRLITDSGSTEEAQTPSLAPLGIDSIDTEAENLEDNIAKINMMLEEDGGQMPLLQLATGSRSVEGALAQPSAVLAINRTLDMEAEIWEDHFERPNQVKVGDTNLQREEGASDSDYFVDALTTLESESESDTESRTWPEPDTHLPKIVVSEEASLLNHSVLKAHVESQRQLLPRGIDLLEEQAGLSHMVMFKPYNVLDVDSPLDLEYEDRCPWMESIKPPIPLRDFGVLETDHHAQCLPPEVVIEDVDRGTHQLSELETKSQPDAGLSSEQNEMGMVALVNLPAQKEHEFQRQRPRKEPASPQLSTAPHDDFVVKSPSLKQCDEHPSSIVAANKPSLGTKHLDIEGEQACSLVASEIVGDKRELDNCSRTTIVLNFETQAWPTQAHESSEPDQTFSDLQTLPHCSIQPQEEESMSELSSLQHKQPPSAVVELTELPVSLETLGADEGNGPGKIAKEFIYNEEGAHGLGGLVSESQAQPGLDEVTILGEGSQLLNHSAEEKHVESRRQRRRWDINRVHEQAQVPQLAVEPEDDVVIESPEQITSAVDSIEPQLFFQSRGTMRGNGHAQLTNNTMGDKMQSELKLQGWPHPNDVLEARVPAESPIQSSSHTAPKKPAKSRRQRPSKSMDLEKAVCQTKLKHEDLRNKSSVRRQPHSVVMLTKPPTFLEYLGTRRGNGDMSMECDSLSAHGQKLDDQGSQESPGFRSQGLDFTELDEASPLTHSDMKKHAESRRQRPRWDINKVKKQLVLTEILRPESDLVTASSALDTEEPDSLVELSKPQTMSSSKGIKLPHSPVINGHAQVISNEQRVDDPEADRDSPELSEPPMAPEEVGLANSPEANGHHHAHVVNGHIVENQARTDHDSVEVSEPPVMPFEEAKIKKPWTILNGHAQVVSSEQIVDGQGLDCDSLDVKELILRSDPCSADHNAVCLYKGEDTLPHENHHGIEQEPRTKTSLPSLSSSPYTLLSSPTSDDNRDQFDCTSSASSPQWSTPSNALHSPPDSPARSSRGLFLSSPVDCNNSKFCTESGIIVEGPPAHVPVPSSCPMTSTCLPIQQDSIDDRPSHSWNLWSCQTLKLPPRAIPLVTQQLQQSSPRVSSSPDSNQMSDAEIDEALMDAISGNCMVSVITLLWFSSCLLGLLPSWVNFFLEEDCTI